MSTYSYACRSECFLDICSLMATKELHIWEISITQEPVFPDCEFRFKSSLPIEKLLAELASVYNQLEIHVIFQTLQYADKYDGERDYERSPDNYLPMN